MTTEGSLRRPTKPADAAARATPGRAEVLAPAPTVPFLLVVILAVVEYARPQDVIPLLGLVRPSLLLTLTLLVCLFQHRHRIRLSEPVFPVCGLLLIFMAFWVPLARNNYWAFLIFRNMVLVAIFVVAFVTFVDTRARLQRFVVAWLIAGIFQAYWGITHEGRGTGSFLGDENDFALHMNICLPFVLLIPRTIPSKEVRFLCYLAVPVFVVGVVSSFSRGGFVGLVVTAGVLVAMSRHRIPMLALLVAGGLLFVTLAPPGYLDEIRTISDREDSTRQARIKMWTSAWRTFVENPVFGVGQGNIAWRLGDYEVFDPVIERSYAGHPVHSVYLTALPELGLIGTSLYVLLVASVVLGCVRLILRPRLGQPPFLDPYARAVVGSLAAFLSCGLFLSTLYYPHLYYLMAMSTVLSRLSHSNQRVEGECRHLPTNSRDLSLQRGNAWPQPRGPR